MYTNNRDEEVKLLKRLWTSQPTLCPDAAGQNWSICTKKQKRAIATGSVLRAVKFTEPFTCLKRFPMNKSEFVSHHGKQGLCIMQSPCKYFRIHPAP